MIPPVVTCGGNCPAFGPKFMPLGCCVPGEGAPIGGCEAPFSGPDGGFPRVSARFVFELVGVACADPEGD